jgi:hypothetical protein
MFSDDMMSEYRCFRNIFEEVLYKEMFKPVRVVRKMPENIGHIYFIYGCLLYGEMARKYIFVIDLQCIK